MHFGKYNSMLYILFVQRLKFTANQIYHFSACLKKKFLSPDRAKCNEKKVRNLVPPPLIQTPTIHPQVSHKPCLIESVISEKWFLYKKKSNYDNIPPICICIFANILQIKMLLFKKYFDQKKNQPWTWHQPTIFKEFLQFCSHVYTHLLNSVENGHCSDKRGSFS
jgi:hypothetical protein